jgi:hypothetical protein
MVLMKDINISPIFFLILTLATVFSSDLLPCELRNELATNSFVKHFIVFLIIFFAVDDEQLTTNEDIRKAICYYIIFVLFTKTPLIFSGFILVVLAFALLVQKFINELDQKREPKKREVQFLELLKFLFAGLLVVGFLCSLDSKIDDQNFDFFNFLFAPVQLCEL